LFLPPTAAGVAQHNQWFIWAALPLALFTLITQVTTKKLDAKSIALLGVLVAVMAALRPLGAGAIGIEPMWFILILAARVFGPGFGLTLGITGIFFSACLTGGFGPWLAYQMFAAGWLGLFAGLLPKRISGRREIAMLVLYGVFASFLFGLLMDLQFWPWAIGATTQLSFSPAAPLATNIIHFVIFHFATSMAWDLPRAIFTALLILIAGPALLTASPNP
jgi:energy-coupling factor transport system substrate-specific component